MYLHLSKPTKNFTQKGPKQTLPATEVVIDGMKLTTSDKNNNNYRTFTFV